MSLLCSGPRCLFFSTGAAQLQPAHSPSSENVASEEPVSSLPYVTESSAHAPYILPLHMLRLERRWLAGWLAGLPPPCLSCVRSTRVCPWAPCGAGAEIESAWSIIKGGLSGGRCSFRPLLRSRYLKRAPSHLYLTFSPVGFLCSCFQRSQSLLYFRWFGNGPDSATLR